MKEISFETCDFENPAHLNALVELLNAYISDDMGGGLALNKLQQLRLVDGLANHPSALVLFMLCDNQVAGFTTCFINFSTFNVKSYLNIHDFFVLSSFRGQGLGKKLMEQLIIISEERKYCKITLEVREDNIVAQSLYKDLGYDACSPNMLFWTKKL
jgi:ribosomal protein S18 acetylase RimI-like enzyme